MSTNILAAIRTQKQLHGNLKFTAIEVAHLMNTSGYGRVAYAFMGFKTGYSRRTVIRHMHQLVAMRIYEKTVYRLKFGNAINLYKCLLSIPAFYRGSPCNAKGDNVTPILPTPKTEEGKSLSLEEEICRLRKGLRFCTPGSAPYVATQEKIDRLTQLLRQ